MPRPSTSALFCTLAVLGACAGPSYRFDPQDPRRHSNGVRPKTVFEDDDVQVYASQRGDPDPRLLLGLGFTADPTAFNFSVQGDFPVGRSVIIGPLLQAAASDDEELLALTFNLKKEVEVNVEVEGDSWSFYPSAQIGVGGAYLEKENRPGDDDDFGALVNFGLGLRAPLDRHVSVGTGILFNVMPGEVLDERFFFTWQVFQMSIDF